jgi:hypothetical protein
MAIKRNKDTLYSNDLTLISEEHLRQMTIDIALQKAMSGNFIFLPHGGRMFNLPEQCWESLAIRSLAGVALAESIMTLQMAMRNPEVKKVFIPSGSLLHLEDIERVCQRCGVGKTIFREVTSS